ncbi:MAG: helix-turn-helix transcriptional regulator [Clostridia bacterium]|nr:helix-turn-helix transcriptional regulator [Clostridia bacterium]
MRAEIPYPRIRDLREDHDWKQAALADRLGISQTRYSKYEIGTCEIPVSILIQLAQIYNTSIDYLLGQTNNPNRYEE